MAKGSVQVALIGLGLFAGFRWLQSRAKKIDFERIKIPYQALKPTGISLKLVLPVINRSGLALTVQSFVGAIKNKQGQIVAYVNSSKPIQVPQFGRVEMEYDVTIGYVALGLEAVNILQNGGKIETLGYSLEGTVQLPGNFQVDVIQKII